MPMTPMYNTMTFYDIYKTVDDFKEDYETNGLPTLISEESVNTLFYLLIARYKNSPISNNDVSQFKYRLFSTVWQYGPAWEKRLEIQAKLRGLTEADIREGTKLIMNGALNPESAPSTDTLDELAYINQQNTNKVKKSKIDGLAAQWELLKLDVSEEFLNKFRKLFKQVVRPENPLLYYTEGDEE